MCKDTLACFLLRDCVNILVNLASASEPYKKRVNERYQLLWQPFLLFVFLVGVIRAWLLVIAFRT